MPQDMTQYQKQNAAEKIDGYFIPRPGELAVEALARARIECTFQLKMQLACVAELTPQDFFRLTNRLGLDLSVPLIDKAPASPA